MDETDNVSRASAGLGGQARTFVLRGAGPGEDCSTQKRGSGATSGRFAAGSIPTFASSSREQPLTSDASLLLPRELDEQLGLSGLIERRVADPRTGHNRQFPLPDRFRQSNSSWRAGYRGYE